MADNLRDRSDNFFGELRTETCDCGHRINITDSREHTCADDCRCDNCRRLISRQLRLIEED